MIMDFHPESEGVQLFKYMNSTNGLIIVASD